MKTILLSFNPLYFEPLKNGTKKYEYRSRFTDEKVKAYLYLSSPVRKVVAVVYFGKRIPLENMKVEYSENDMVVKRIEEYIHRYKKNYAIPVERIEFIEPISLQHIRDRIPRFMPPQSYMIVKDNSTLELVLKETKHVDHVIEIDHNNIFPDDICVN